MFHASCYVFHAMRETQLTTNDRCRMCRGTHLVKVFAFGPTPPANAFLTKAELTGTEPFFPLDVYFCEDCTLLQLRDVVDPEILFRNYLYVSSTSPAFVAHFESFARSVIERLLVQPGSLVIDIGSNDGILLKPFKALGMRVLGIDPATEIARRAAADGIPTIPEFLSSPLADRIVAEYGKAAIITANNVFAHINDLEAVVASVKQLLAPNGVFIIEAPYLVDFIEKKLFDTVYHEHLSYLAIRPLDRFFQSQGLKLFHAERTGSHGGSIRVFVERAEAARARTAAVDELLTLETTYKLGEITTYHAFARAIEKNKIALRDLLTKFKAEGKRIAGYGAPAKGNTLLNYFGIGPDTLDYVIDDSVYKQGLYTPGTHIPVVAASELETNRPDYLCILAWNFADPIMKKCASFSQSGGCFILPVPEPHIV